MFNEDELVPEVLEFLNCFQKHFHIYKNNKIVIYGIGKITEYVLKYLPEYNIFGILDRDPDSVGKKIFNVEVITPEIAKQAEMIIIFNRGDNIRKIIFDRISYFLTEYNIPIYYIDGSSANIEENEDISNNSYWDLTLKKMKDMVDKYQIISFDIFDTLVMRKVYSSSDIFELLNLQLKTKYGGDFEFPKVRKFAEEYLKNHGEKVPTFEQIYDVVQERLCLSEEQKKYIMEAEIDLEYSVIIPRDDMVDLFNYAISKNKRVYLLSDMYLPQTVIEKILFNCGICGYSELWVSCEKKISKEEQSLWEEYNKKTFGYTRLHIGDHFQSDIQNPLKYNICSIQVLRAQDMLSASSMKIVIPNICTIEESVIVGCIISRLFNSPFALAETKGKVIIESLDIMGYVVYATPIFNYIFWILKETINSKTDKLLFFARDGFFLKQAYYYITQKFALESYPEGLYLISSRMLLIMMTIYTKEDILNILKTKFRGKFKDLMKYRLGIDVGNDIHADDEIDTYTEYSKIVKFVEFYYERIIKNACSLRLKYKLYMKTLNILEYDKIATIDPSYNGTDQYYLSKLTGKEYVGYYCYADISGNNIYQQQNNMRAFYQDCSDLTAEHCSMFKYCAQFEGGIMVAPTGAVIGIDDDNNFIYTPLGRTQQKFNNKETMFHAVREFIDDVCLCYKNISYSWIKPVSLFVDNLFGEFMSSNCDIKQEVKDTFYSDNFYDAVWDINIW